MAPVCVVVGASSKWQATGSSAVKEHQGVVVDEGFPDKAKWGVGGAVSIRFAEGGFDVALFSRSPQNVRQLAEVIERRGSRALCVACELADPGSIAAAFDEVRARLGHPEVLVYNAGYTSHGASEVLIEDLPIQLLDDAHDAQCRGAVLCCQQVLPAMRETGVGTILFSSVPASLRASARGLPNSISKAGMRALAQAVAEEYQGFGVHSVHCVLNGLIDSPGTHDWAKKMAGRSPRPSVMDPAAIAESYWQLHVQDPSVWTTETVMTPAAARIAGRL